VSKALTTAAIAERFGVNFGKVCEWIRAGELKAINVAQNRSSRPKYRVTQEQLDAFERSRTIGAPEKPSPRRKRGTAEAVPNYV
jgi:hypothetical protein